MFLFFPAEPPEALSDSAPHQLLQPLQKDINIFISIYDNYTVAKKNKQPKTILQTHAVDLRKYMDRFLRVLRLLRLNPALGARVSFRGFRALRGIRAASQPPEILSILRFRKPSQHPLL